MGFLFDTPACSAATCPEMRASEWQFLCAVHEQPKSCCAIDYCCHTLDWAANVVTDQKIFASRLVALSDAHNKNMAMKNLVNVFRRLHRIFAHAWFQHRSVFWSVEGQTGLYIFFKRVCDMYDLIPGETYKLPPEAEGLEPEVAPVPEPPAEKADVGGPPLPLITRTQTSEKVPEPITAEEEQGVGRTNTRRHIRSSPSTGSAVTTVIEADEDETADLTKKTKDLSISAPPAPLEEEPEAEEVPVIVEDSVIHQSAETTASPTDEVETPVQETPNVDELASGDKPTETESEAAAGSGAPAGESQAESHPPAPETEPTGAEEAKPETEKASEEDSAKQKEGDDTPAEDAAPTEPQEKESAGDSPPEPEASSAPEKPSDTEATGAAEPPPAAMDSAPDVKAEEEPKKE